MIYLLILKEFISSFLVQKQVLCYNFGIKRSFYPGFNNTGFNNTNRFEAVDP